jgi:HTH-type transcriptional regulator/antitoxin HigA
MKPKIIKTKAEYQATLARIEKIFDARPGTAKGDELELLLLLVETYEEQAYPIDPPDPIAALRFRMEQEGLKPKDLIPYIGSKSKVSEVLSGRRPLSLTMIRKLVAGLHLPAEVALREPKPRSARRTAYAASASTNSSSSRISSGVKKRSTALRPNTVSGGS